MAIEVLAKLLVVLRAHLLDHHALVLECKLFVVHGGVGSEGFVDCGVAKVVLAVVRRGPLQSTRGTVLTHPVVSFLFNFFLCWWRFRPVLYCCTFFNVSFCCFFAKFSSAMWTIYHVLILAWYLVCQCPYLILNIWVIINIWILLQSIDLFAKPHRLDKLVPIFLPFGRVASRVVLLSLLLHHLRTSSSNYAF